MLKMLLDKTIIGKDIPHFVPSEMVCKNVLGSRRNWFIWLIGHKVKQIGLICVVQRNKDVDVFSSE